jgi:hypothetical protein
LALQEREFLNASLSDSHIFLEVSFVAFLFLPQVIMLWTRTDSLEILRLGWILWINNLSDEIWTSDLGLGMLDLCSLRKLSLYCDNIPEAIYSY